MKTAAVGVFAAMVATAQAGAVEEETGLQSYVEGRMLQFVDIDGPEDETMEEMESSENEQSRRRRRGGKGGKGRRGGKGGKGGRRGKWGKGKGKDMLENFNYAEFEEKLAEKEAKMKERIPKKCDKKKEMGMSVCGQIEEEDQKARCEAFINSNHVKCTEMGLCKASIKTGKKRCGMAMKFAMMGIFMPEKLPEMPEGITVDSNTVAECHKDLIDGAADCQADAAPKIAAAMGDFEPPTEEELAQFKEAMKQARKAKRGGRNNSLGSSRGGRNNRRRQNRRRSNRRNNRRDEQEESDYDGEGDYDDLE